MKQNMSDTHSAGCCRIPPQSGVAFTLRANEILRIYDPYGEQVADLFAFAANDHRCSLSSGRTIDYASSIYLTKGDVLYANDSQRMFQIVDDAVGRHDFLLTPCSQEMFELLYQHEGHHPSCFENLYRAFAPFGIRPEQIGTTFNIFMNVVVAEDGKVKVKPPLSRAGDFIELRAEMDLVCGLTSCSAENSNNGSFKPIDYEIRPGSGRESIEVTPSGDHVPGSASTASPAQKAMKQTSKTSAEVDVDLPTGPTDDRDPAADTQPPPSDAPADPSVAKRGA